MTNADVPTKTDGQSGVLRKVLFGAVLALAAAAIGYFVWTRTSEMSVANKEIEAQKSEVEECKKNMATFYDAWQRYAKDHKGQEPSSYAQLVPKYISDPNMLMCPTAKRWMSKGKRMSDVGSIRVAGKEYPVTYGFVAFAASYQIALRQFGGRTPIVNCEVHREGVYRAVYNHGPPLNAFDPSQRAGLNEAVRDTKTVVLHKNGVVDLQADE